MLMSLMEYMKICQDWKLQQQQRKQHHLNTKSNVFEKTNKQSYSINDELIYCMRAKYFNRTQYYW